MKKIALLLSIVLSVIGCSTFKPEVNQTSQNEVANEKLSYLSGDTVIYKIREIENLSELASRSLEVNDSLGALAYFESAHGIFMDIPLKKREELLADSTFALFFEQNINQPYTMLKDNVAFLETDTTSTDQVRMELDEFISEEVSAIDSTDIKEETGLEIPEEINHKVQLAIKYFTTTSRGRRVMTRWLQRMTKYEKLMKSILKEEGAPEDLFYLALVESGLNPRARSYARAVGPWQFINSTGKAYGLHNSFWYDERSDFVKSTRAAAQHLLDLYRSFGDWYFAMAGYNYSPRRLKRKIRQYNAKTFWEVKRLPRQTRNYIPTYLATRHIANNFTAYGFKVDSLPPITFDTVTIKESLDMAVIAKMVDTTYEAIRDLNPAVKRWVTPPDVDSWTLYLPEGSRDKFIEKYKKIPDSEKRYYVRHKVRSGQTLSHISYRYGVPIWLIKKYNRIRGTMIRVGQNLIIPVPADKKAYYAQLRKSSSPKRKSSGRRVKKPVIKGKKLVVYSVEEGDNLFDISMKFGVTVSKLKYWNNLYHKKYIHPGQKLNIWLPKEVADRVANDSSVKNTGAGMATIVVKTGIDGQYIVHEVKRGDTLWDIAKKYHTSIRNIKEWNSKKNNKIKPGEKLIIYR